MKDSKSKTQKASHAVANQALQKKSNGRSLPSANTAQLQGEEEELQMKSIVQKAAPEEELQMKSIIQKAAPEEELQMKSIVQKASPEEELQMKSIVQKAGPEEELQMKEKENNTGLPDSLKAGVESLSGMGLDDVNVHYNSPQPAQLNAHAFAQGTDIHVAAGQEQHLAHEAWHVAQQKQGRVKPTIQKAGVSINDDAGLEKEADEMGAKAAQRFKK